jgi:septum formation protein
VSAPPAVVLASASSRRDHLLRQAGLVFEVVPADVDESLEEDLEPEVAAERLAARKAEAVAARIGPADRWVLGADTVVAVDSEEGTLLLGKPNGAAEARTMLARLSGTTHRVATGVCVVDARSGRRRCAVEVTRVTMRTLSTEEIAAYVASGEWEDKAGGYAIQERADRGPDPRTGRLMGHFGAAILPGSPRPDRRPRVDP